MSKINRDLVTLNVVNSFLLAFRWGLVAVVVTVMVGLGLQTWKAVDPKPRTMIIEQRIGALPPLPLTADEATYMNSQHDYEDETDGAK